MRRTGDVVGSQDCAALKRVLLHRAFPVTPQITSKETSGEP
jgi:hypothetical protein